MQLQDYLPTSKLHKHPDLFSFLAVSLFNPYRTYSIYETLNGEGIGRTFFDPDGSGHEIYGVSKNTSDVIILLVRPDGWVGGKRVHSR